MSDSASCPLRRPLFGLWRVLEWPLAAFCIAGFAAFLVLFALLGEWRMVLPALFFAGIDSVFGGRFFTAHQLLGVLLFFLVLGGMVCGIGCSIAHAKEASALWTAGSCQMARRTQVKAIASWLGAGVLAMVYLAFSIAGAYARPPDVDVQPTPSGRGTGVYPV